MDIQELRHRLAEYNSTAGQEGCSSVENPTVHGTSVSSAYPGSAVGDEVYI